MNTPSFLDVRLHRLDPMRAEVRLRWRAPEQGGELRGRLMGPRCRFTSTIEIAYPVRPTNVAGEFAIVVPEPSLWEPAKPFVYEGPIEKIAADGASASERLRLCFRSLKVGPAGLLLNGKAVTLLGKEAAALPDENELLQWRGKGVNAVLIPESAAQARASDLSETAVNWGFLLILRDKPGDNGQESFCCLLEGPMESTRLQLPGITRQADGSFTLIP